MSSPQRLSEKHDVRFSEVDEYAIPLSKHLALRVYSDTKPHKWKTADLQKGLILVYKGVEMIGEGTGFGVPVIICSDETYFSGSSHVYLSVQDGLTVIRKEFFMDIVSRAQFKHIMIRNRKLRGLLKYITETYQEHSHLRFLTLKKLYLGAGVHTRFLRVSPKTKIVVTYRIDGDRVLVKADFSLVKKLGLLRVFVMNEQGATFFRKYADSDGRELFDKEIGAWDPIQGKWASITDLEDKVGFRLGNVNKSLLRRGREFLDDCLDWVGLDYEVDPKRESFSYEIEILGS